MKNPTVIATIVIGLLAAVVTFLFIKKKGAPPPGPKPTASYVVAKEAIPPRVPITDAMVEEQKASGNQDPAYFASKGEVLGKTVGVAIAKGQRIKKEAIPVSAKTFPLPVERRGIALFLDPNLSAAGLLNVGDHVDVLVVYNEGNDAVARTVAQDCVVVSQDRPGEEGQEQPAAQGKAGGKAEAKSETKGGAAPPTGKMLRIVLAVTPEDAVKITAATQKGDVRLSLRNPQNAMSAQVEEEWEHPHRIHKHYPFPAPASPENIPKRPTGPGPGAGPSGPSTAQFPSAAATVPPAPFMRRGGIPGPPGLATKPKEKSVEVVRGINKETVTVPE